MVRKSAVSIFAVLTLSVFAAKAIAQPSNIYQATLGEPNQKTQEVSTEYVRNIVANGGAIILDTRSRSEYASGHIPAARVLEGSASAAVAAVERLLGGDKNAAVVLYCNSPYCGQSRRLGDQLAASGFTNVRRYQLGIAVWRALGGPTEIELDAIVRIFKADHTAFFIDARSAEEFAKGTLPGAHNVPVAEVTEIIKRIASGQRQNAPFPEDFNSRIVLFGRDAAQARTLADVLATRPWHNVGYFRGTFETLRAAIGDK